MKKFPNKFNYYYNKSLDDLFEDDDVDSSNAANDDVAAPLEKQKKKYLDEDWQLNQEDAKEFKGFPNTKTNFNENDLGEALNVPCFAVMYKFRREYLDANVDSIVADHNGYCNSFKRLINSEIINMGKTKGAVMLWAGYTLDDKDETKSDIMQFLEDDPLILKDVVEKWDLIDLEKSETGEIPLKKTIQK